MRFFFMVRSTLFPWLEGADRPILKNFPKRDPAGRCLLPVDDIFVPIHMVGPFF